MLIALVTEKPALALNELVDKRAHWLNGSARLVETSK